MWGLVAGALTHAGKGHGFNSQSRHIHRFSVEFQLWPCRRKPINVSLSHQFFTFSLSPSLPLFKIHLKNISSFEDLTRKRLILHYKRKTMISRPLGDFKRK